MALWTRALSVRLAPQLPRRSSTPGSARAGCSPSRATTSDRRAQQVLARLARPAPSRRPAGGGAECLGGHPRVSHRRRRLAVPIDADAAAPPPPRARRPRAVTEGPQPALHVRHLRRRLVEPVRPGRLPGRRRAAVARVQPALSSTAGSGLGKTHLLHAVGHQTAKLFAGLPSSTSRRSASPTSSSTRSATTARRSSAARYRTIDLLLIDDIQFISGKERTQEEFFHTFNDLYESRKQIIVSSDCSPKDIPEIEERLRSRFEWGLIADIQPPGLRDARGDPQEEGGRRARAPRRRRRVPHRRPGQVQHPRARGLPDPHDRLLRAHRPRDGRRPRPGSARRALGRGREGHHHRADPAQGRRLLRPQARRTSRRRTAPRPWPSRARSRCTSPASSPTPRSPRSAAPSAARTTRRSSTPWTRSRRSSRKIPSYARPSTGLSRGSRSDPPPPPRSSTAYPHGDPLDEACRDTRFRRVPAVHTPYGYSYYEVVFLSSLNNIGEPHGSRSGP